MMTMMRRLPPATVSLTTALSWRFPSPTCRPSHQLYRASPNLISSYPRIALLSFFCSTNSQISNPIPQESSKHGPLQPGLYLVGTPIGNLEDITLRALRVLKSADVILSEDTRHSGKLLQHYNITTPLLSYHKFNESQREQSVLKRLKQGEIVVLISDAGTPGISDPGTELAKLCVGENIPVIPIPGPCAVVAALSASGLATDEFTFVGFLPKHAGSRKERLAVCAKETRTQIFYVPPHKLSQFLEEMSSLFVDSRRCVIAREMTKLHEEFWRGTLAEAKEQFSDHQPKGEITLLIEGKAEYLDETPSEGQLELELRDLISSGHSLSMWQEQDMVMLVMPPKPVGMVLQCFSKALKKIIVQFDQELVTINHVVPCYNHAVKLVAEATSVKRKTIYSLALRKFGKQIEAEDSSN